MFTSCKSANRSGLSCSAIANTRLQSALLYIHPSNSAVHRITTSRHSGMTISWHEASLSMHLYLIYNSCFGCNKTLNKARLSTASLAVSLSCCMQSIRYKWYIKRCPTRYQQLSVLSRVALRLCLGTAIERHDICVLYCYAVYCNHSHATLFTD